MVTGRAKPVSVDFQFRGVTIRIQGSDYFYGDSDITEIIGADITDDDDLDDGLAIDKKVQYERILIPLTAVLKKSNFADLGDAAQSSTTRYFDFYCNPDNVGRAMSELPQRDIDSNLLPGDWKISKVMPPKTLSYR